MHRTTSQQGAYLRHQVEIGQLRMLTYYGFQRLFPDEAACAAYLERVKKTESLDCAAYAKRDGVA